MIPVARPVLGIEEEEAVIEVVLPRLVNALVEARRKELSATVRVMERVHNDHVVAGNGQGGR